MALSEAKKRAIKKWNDKNMKERYERIQVVIPKGKKEIIQAVASSNGESVNGMINRLLEDELKKHEDVIAGISGISEDV